VLATPPFYGGGEVILERWRVLALVAFATAAVALLQRAVRRCVVAWCHALCGGCRRAAHTGGTGTGTSTLEAWPSSTARASTSTTSASTSTRRASTTRASTSTTRASRRRRQAAEAEADDPFPEVALASAVASDAHHGDVAPLRPTSTTARSPSTRREQASADFDQLVAMGFGPDEVAAALAESGGERERALNMLLASRI